MLQSDFTPYSHSLFSDYLLLLCADEDAVLHAWSNYMLLNLFHYLSLLHRRLYIVHINCNLYINCLNYFGFILLESVYVTMKFNPFCNFLCRDYFILLFTDEDVALHTWNIFIFLTFIYLFMLYIRLLLLYNGLFTIYIIHHLSLNYLKTN